MPSFRYGGKKGKKYTLKESSQYIVIRTRDRGAFDPNVLSRTAWDLFGKLELDFRLPAAGIEVHKVRVKRGAAKIRDHVRALFKPQRDIEFAGRVLWDRKFRSPVLYTENLFAKFQNGRRQQYCQSILKDHALSIKREIPYLQNGYFVEAPKGSGQEVFAAAERLLSEEAVELCHPELIRKMQHRQAFPQQWHLKKTTIDGRVIEAHASVEDTWRITKGKGIVIAVIDDGFDLNHEEFARPDKIVGPRDVTLDTDDPRPGSEDDHGTACAGVACADGLHGASGVAPEAQLMPIRLVSGIGSQDEADALVWAAEHGADVISCSWGPGDGDWHDEEDPRHNAEHLLPDSTRLALEWVTENGRGRKGCIVTWAAGNGNESVDNDGYASSNSVIAVAACNDENTRSVYSDYGNAIWCCFPSNDYASTTRTRGIWTTDRSGAAGYNPGLSKRGDRRGNYTNSFAGTSSACPGVAGVAALLLSVNPNLTWKEVKEIIKKSCDKIDADHGNYDVGGHSAWYGFGRVNASQAVKLAKTL